MSLPELQVALKRSRVALRTYYNLFNVRARLQMHNSDDHSLDAVVDDAFARYIQLFTSATKLVVSDISI